jgi:uncharacterized protein
MAGEQMSWRERLTSASGWSDVAHNFRGDWQMLYKEITVGFLLAGFIAQLGIGFFNGLFLKGAPALVQVVWGALIGPVIALMFVTMVLAALIVNGLFSAAGLIPTGPRPSRGDIFGTIAVNYKLILNVLGLVIFAALFWLTARRGVTDPVCGMKVDKAKAIRMDFGEETFYFCSEHCLHAFEVSPAEHLVGQST